MSTTTATTTTTTATTTTTTDTVTTTYKFILQLEQMFLALNDCVLITSDDNDVRVVSVTSRETKVDVELLSDTTDSATTTTDDTRVNTMVYLH